MLGFKDANSTEFNEDSEYPVIDLMLSQKSVTQKGGTMRLGAYPCTLKAGSIAAKSYGAKDISERHRHRYEFNNTFKKELEKNGLNIVGTSPDGKLVEIVEIPQHPWFVACQFHPEFKSKPLAPHPLFRDFVKAAMDNKK
jgi:CTP synthase